MSNRTFRVLLALLGCSLGSACTLESNSAPLQSQASIYVDGGVDVTSFSGVSFDPEAFFAIAAGCGSPDCPPPFLAPGIPAYEGSLVSGAQVQVFDPDQGAPAGSTNSASDGQFSIDGIPSRSTSPYFMLASGGAINSDPSLPQVPAASYQPTFAMRPIMASYSSCLFQQAPVIGDKGILEAVAKYLTSKGTATTAADLLDPSKYGGVAIWWLYQPGLPVAQIPAFGTRTDADQGTVLQIDWAPPGTLGLAIQSTRGFYVAEGATMSPLGVTVIVLPASASGPAFVTFTPTDPTTDATQGRPWQFGSITAPVVPGVVSFAGIQLFPSPAPDDPGPLPASEGAPVWLCLPQ